MQCNEMNTFRAWVLIVAIRKNKKTHVSDISLLTWRCIHAAMMRKEHYPPDTVRTILEANGNSPAVTKEAKMCQEHFSTT